MILNERRTYPLSQTGPFRTSVAEVDRVTIVFLLLGLYVLHFYWLFWFLTVRLV